MTIDSIQNGYVIDHIPAGRAMALYTHLGLEGLGCPVAMIMNAASGRMGRKDIIKIDGDLDLPENLTGVIRCRNPRCITSTERDLPALFKLTDREKRVYRCVYCEAKYEG